MNPHPLAAVFPMMTTEEHDALVSDIREHGLRDAIVLLDDMILDGRNRHRACLEAGIEPRFVDFAGDDPLGFIISHNLHRRHLTASQRAMVAARLADMKHGGDRGVNQHGTWQERNSDLAKVSVVAAAGLLNVNKESVSLAKRIQREGVPELIEAVERGEAAVDAAADVARLPEQEQREAVATGKVRDVSRVMRGDTASKIDRSRAGVAARREAIRSLTEAGHSIADIAQRVAMTPESVRNIAYEMGIETVDARLGKRRRIDPNTVVDGIVQGAVVPRVTIDLLEGRYADLDRERIPDWIDALTDSIRALSQLRSRIREELS